MHRFTGFSLIEVLISLSILSFILLGWNTMQLIAVKGARGSYHHAVAMYQVDAMAERIRAAKGEVSEELTTFWEKQNQEILPRGRGEIHVKDPNVQITLYWGKSHALCNFVSLSPSGCIRLTQRI